MLRILNLVLLAVYCASCGQPPESQTPEVRKDPVVVYAAFEDDAALVNASERYTEKTGVLVIVRRGVAARIVDDLIKNKVSPPADVLATRSVVDAWRAADESALRPLFSEPAREQVPAWARDLDDLWFGTKVHSAVIVHNLAGLHTDDVPDVGALAKPQLSGMLCLSSSVISVNRTVIATMVSELGDRPAELVVRGWINNLAAPPFDDEEQLIRAIQSGACGIGIVSNTALAIANADLEEIVPATWYADVETVGIARHARNPDGATNFVEWLLADSGFTEVVGDQSVARENVSIVAWHAEDAIKLAERARYD
jgi:iron(III) transport system substrate-binding protein